MKSTKVNYDHRDIQVTCPICDRTIYVPRAHEPSVRAGCTLDCLCESLLVIENSVVYDFHEKLNSKDPRWPKDGAGTGSVEIAAPAAPEAPKTADPDSEPV